MGPETDPVVIVRFIGSTQLSTDLRTLLQSICEQIALNYRCLIHFLPNKIQEMRELLINLLGESSFHRPLVIILDALEQLSDADEVRKLWWLPIHLPRTVRIVVSTLPNKHGILQKLRHLIHDEDYYVELIQRDRKICSQTLKQQLLGVKRKVTSGQQIYVNEAHAKVSHGAGSEAHAYLTDVIALQEDEELRLTFNAAVILRASVTAFGAGWWPLCTNCG